MPLTIEQAEKLKRLMYSVDRAAFREGALDEAKGESKKLDIARGLTDTRRQEFILYVNSLKAI